MTIFDERMFEQREREKTIQNFLDYVERYDEEMSHSMRAKGYKCKNRAERTVAFTFGEVTFSRKRWYKNGQCYIPVDEMLGLEKNVRHSPELIYQSAILATRLPYRQVGKTIEMMYHVTVSKDMVNKVVKLANQLLEERAEYRFYEEEKVDKIEAKLLFIEGDGVYVKTSEDGDERQNMDLSHFVIHTGSKEVSKNRYELENKKEIISSKNKEAREELLDYLYNHYTITDETILITNSDGGKGYTPYVFKEIAKALNIKRHEHFWDSYHGNKDIKDFTKPYAKQLQDDLFQAIREHDKSLLRRTLDTIESLVETERQETTFAYYASKFLRQFQYTKPA
ncbi:UPF0236 family transposase-like protein, partial [Streptococcus sp. DD10]|uniref:UPF0236 family transposase-like protein n=1 Tax=Streptococcus sp. DD10 TaxID=1777878 RepID=UPI001E5243BB